MPLPSGASKAGRAGSCLRVAFPGGLRPKGGRFAASNLGGRLRVLGPCSDVAMQKKGFSPSRPASEAAALVPSQVLFSAVFERIRMPTSSRSEGVALRRTRPARGHGSGGASGAGRTPVMEQEAESVKAPWWPPRPGARGTAVKTLRGRGTGPRLARPFLAVHGPLPLRSFPLPFQLGFLRPPLTAYQLTCPARPSPESPTESRVLLSSVPSPLDQL